MEMSTYLVENTDDGRLYGYNRLDLLALQAVEARPFIGRCYMLNNSGFVISYQLISNGSEALVRWIAEKNAS